MPIKFFIWTGEIPQVEDQTVLPSGDILNPMPADGYVEYFTPFSAFFKGDDPDKDARTYVVAYFSTKADGRSMVFTCWDQHFDGIYRLLTHENKKIARGTKRAIEESWPIFATVLERGPDTNQPTFRGYTEVGASQEKTLLAVTFVPVAEVTSPSELFKGDSGKAIVQVLKTSIALVPEIQAGLPNLADCVGEEKSLLERFDQIAQYGEELRPIFDAVSPFLGG
jgi:hypothetical protein